MLRNSSADIGPPEAEDEIGSYNNHQQGQNSIPLSANALELRPDRFGLHQNDQEE